ARSPCRSPTPPTGALSRAVPPPRPARPLSIRPMRCSLVASHGGIRIECRLSGLLQIHDRLSIPLPGRPPVDVDMFGIEAACLKLRIEAPEVGCSIRSAARNPLPVESVVGEVRIDERVPEPPGPLLPANQQVLDQERGNYHPHPVVHPTRCPELAHACIHQRD